MKYPENSIDKFLTAIASRKPTPGGGSAAALSGSLAAALLAMSCRLTDNEICKAIIVEAETIRRRLEQLIDEDANSYRDYLRATIPEKETALKNAALIPFETATLSFRILELTNEIITACRKSVITDTGTAALLAEAAVHAACFNTAINLKSIDDTIFREEMGTKLKSFASSSVIRQAIINYVNNQLG
ncbi:cyclodeaminase/cyclohydrolase family protein [Chloroflexota bacterium]